MPATITLKQLSYSTPDQQTLFDALDLTFGAARTGLIGRNGAGKSTLLRLITGQLRPTSGEITVTGRLGLLRQIVQTGADDTLAHAFGIADALARLDRIEAGAGSDADLAEADWSLPARYEAAMASTGLAGMPPTRLVSTLSGGQRTRAALAALLFDAPDMILLDEPTNNLDAEGRAAVAEVLAGWRGGAVVVSHDRDLLRRMDAIVELSALGARTYGGNWDLYAERKAIEREAAAHALAGAERRLKEIDRKTQASRERQAQSDRGGQRKAMRGDLPKILLGGRRNTAENTAGDAARLASRRREQAQDEAEAARGAVERLSVLSVKLAASGLAAGKTIVQADSLTGGPVPGAPVVRNVSFAMVGPERVAISGPNGSGKTSLLRLLTGALPPVSGSARIFGRFAMLDQQVSLLDPALSIRDNFRALNPGDDENACRAALARFLFRADAALRLAGELSGGELLRAGLACTLGGRHPPELLILDEPTNHLDIASVEAVEAGLLAYDGALLVVSHDGDFLRAIGVDRAIALGGSSPSGRNGQVGPGP